MESISAPSWSFRRHLEEGAGRFRFVQKDRNLEVYEPLIRERYRKREKAEVSELPQSSCFLPENKCVLSTAFD